jgi:tetratricopeptide (TPR) repeat protein
MNVGPSESARHALRCDTGFREVLVLRLRIRRLFDVDGLARPTSAQLRKERVLMKLAIPLAVGALILFPVKARADSVADCNDGSNAVRQIRACTDIINRTMISETLSIAYMNRGIAYAERHQIRKSLADFTSAIAANASNAVAHYNRGNIYFDLRNFHQAAADYSKAIELEPDMAPALLNRGLVNERRGNRASSIADYKAALALDPLLAAATAGLKRLGESQ